ncbi:DNA gyrase C-terminal beta-propeller domain-containing protein, partial [Bacillus pumilus]
CRGSRGLGMCIRDSIRMAVSDISTTGRVTQGVRLIRLGDEEHVATVALVEQSQEDDEDDEENVENIAVSYTHLEPTRPS